MAFLTTRQKDPPMKRHFDASYLQKEIALIRIFVDLIDV